MHAERRQAEVRKRSRNDWAGIPKNKLNDGNRDQSTSLKLFHIYLYFAVCIRKAILLDTFLDTADMRHAGGVGLVVASH